MGRKNKVFATVAAIFCGLIMTACPSLLKNAQTLEIKDESGIIVGKIAGFKVHYPVGNTDADDSNKYEEEHYSIVITNASVDDTISKEEIDQIDSIGVKTSKSGAIINGDKYMCDKIDDKTDLSKTGFSCRFLASKIDSSKIAYIVLLRNDKKTWTSSVIDLNDVTESSELSSEIDSILSGVNKSGTPGETTLKTCPPDASGKTVEVKASGTCPVTETKATDANCIILGNCTPQTNCLAADKVTLIDGSCGTGCGTNQVQKMGKCQCQNGYIADDKKVTCVPDPLAAENNLPPASSSGGGSCSLIKDSLPAPAVTPKTYNLKKMAVPTYGVSVISEPPVLNQLKDVTLVRITNSAGEDIYTLKGTFNATYNGATLGQAQELTVWDISTTGGAPIPMIPKSITSKCVPALSGDTATFTCFYRVSENPTLKTGKLTLFIQLKDLVLFTPDTVNAADFVVAPVEPPTPPVKPPVSSCKDPTPVLMVNGNCGASCGDNEELKDAKCACKIGFSVDATAKACAPTPDLSPTPPAYGGHSCSLNPLATASGELNTILALLLCSMVAARACYSSKN